MLFNHDKGDQPYTYGQRLHMYPVFDEDHESCGYINQLENMRDALKLSIETGIQSNRICSVLWNPLDFKLNDPPCFNWNQARLSERTKVSLRVLFRSNDASNAVFANMGAVTRLFTDEVIKPAGGKLEELIWIAVSEHIYSTDMDMVESLIGKIPEHIRRYL